MKAEKRFDVPISKGVDQANGQQITTHAVIKKYWFRRRPNEAGLNELNTTQFSQVK